MLRSQFSFRKSVAALLLGTVTAMGIGCQGVVNKQHLAEAAMSDIPRELDMSTIPPYRVAPPDILLIEAVNNIRPAEDPLYAGDELIIRASNTFPLDPEADATLNEFKIIRNVYRIQSNGTIDLGPEYGTVKIEGLKLEKAQRAIENHLKDAVGLSNPKVAISLPNVNGKQPISGEHLVRPDGTVSMGIYGSVYVAGMTVEEIKAALEAHLSQHIHRPEISVDVSAYNSKVYYILTDGGGYGETVSRLPFTGNETVLDAIGNIQGLSEVSSKTIWVARPAPNGTEVAQKMYVDWRAITEDGVTTTNYQLMPGDRIYIEADHFIATDSFIAKVVAPWNRIVGSTLVTNSAVRVLKGQSLGSGAGF